MITVKKRVSIALIAAFIFGLGGLTAHKLPKLTLFLSGLWHDLISTKSNDEWNEAFSIVEIPTQNSSEVQLAYAYLKKSENLKPLVVSLHAWVDNYSAVDPLAILIANEGWNYIHPDFQGPNWTRNACLSKNALADIDSAIDFAIKQGSVDIDNIFVVGASGGGYATLGAYLRSKHQIKGFQAWVPISDLNAWFYQSSDRNYAYAEHILKCTSDGENFNRQNAIDRSPLFWEVDGTTNGKLDIFAGITDGYTGSVPVSHSTLFFNKLALEHGFPEAKITEAEIINLLSRAAIPQSPTKSIGGRDIIFSKSTPDVSINIFQGGHEILRDHVLLRIKQLYEGSADTQ